ncbi:MAG TPA: GNAT family N-acetyltransferase [Pseudonocardiaceae bacterium]|nr:GNAT family N-acetyltransferase [Pseudonocardiaceae bacterium]
MTGQLTTRDVQVRPLAQADLAEADRVIRLAFGTFLGLPDPMAFMGDGDYVRSRWKADQSTALAAEADGRVVGSNFATRWGSVGHFGPLTVHPSLWNRGIAHRLLARTMEIMDGWGLSHAGLFTFGHSPKHIALYQAFGFLPRFLTAVLSAPISPLAAPRAGWTTYSADLDRVDQLADCALLTDTIYPGLDVSQELLACHEQGLGDTVLLEDRSGFAVCHIGPGSEADTGTCFIKFAAARTAADFERLVQACEAFAAGHGAARLVAGMNTARRGAYRILLQHKFTADLIGVTMHRPDEPGYSRPDAYVIDDWR